MGRETRITPAAERARIATTIEGDPSGFAIVPAEEAEADVKRVVVELGDSVSESKVQIWRIVKDQRLPAYVKTFAPDMFSMERLAEDCGGGTYDVKLYVPSIDEDGKRLGMKLAARPRVFIDGPMKEIKRPDPHAAVTMSAPERPSEIAQLAGVMLTGFKEMSAAINESNRSRPSLIDNLKELMALKTLFSSDTPKAVDEFDRFERFMRMQDELRSATDRLPGNASGTQSLIALGRDFLSSFRKATDAGAPALPANLPEPDPSRVASVQGSEAEKTPVAPAPIGQEETGMDFIFKGYVKILVDNARANNEVNALAQTIYDQAPEDFLEAMFRDDLWLDRLATYNRDVKLHPAWFERLRARIKEIHDADKSE